MFEVLVYVYENYYTGDSCPEPAHLERKLSAVGFEPDEVEDALRWLKCLNAAARGSRGFAGSSQLVPPVPWLRDSDPTSFRIYSALEKSHLGTECLGFIAFLESNGVLSAPMREVVLDRAMATQGKPMELDDIKLIILMVFWSFGQEPDALVLDELCEDSENRIAH